MILRKNIFPKRVSDACVTLFTLIIIPIVYYFELFIVFPKYYQLWSGWYMFHFLIGTFILFNICSNFIAILVCDTSIKNHLLLSTTTTTTTTVLRPNWKFCSICECITPPRSWHCNTCNICILKRDHHCMFTSCCIGHYNQRYFLIFVLYMFIATTYASYYNLHFIFEFLEFGTWQTIMKLIFPLATLFVDFSIKQFYTFLVLIILITCIFCLVLLIYHILLLLKGVVTYERNQKLSEYDLGYYQNFINVFGKRWYLVWILPFFHSQLPHDGINWDTKQSTKAK